MAIWYFPSGATSSTTDGLAFSCSFSGATDASTVSSTNWGWAPYPRVVVKKVYVKSPEHWDRSIVRAYAKLVNEETSTGWKVTAIIDGDIEILDPYIDVRDMKDFIGLLKARASVEDRKKIDAFFKKVGLEAKPKRGKRAKKSPAPGPGDQEESEQ